MVVNVHRSYSRRCAGIQQVAGFQCEEAADVSNNLVHTEEHVACASFLYGVAVDVEVEVQCLYVAELIHTDPLAYGSRAVETLAEIPRQTGVS